MIAVDTETDALSATAAGLVGISIAVKPGEACYIPLAHLGGDLADGAGRPQQIEMAEAIGLLKPLLEDKSVLKVGQNIKYDLAVLARQGITVAPIEDTMLISYVQEAGLHGHGMDELSELHLGHKPVAFKEVAGTGKNQKHFGEIDLKRATEYAAEDADITLRLYELLKPGLAAKGLASVYETLERPMPAVLAKMELNGIKVDVAQLSRLSSEFAQRMAQAEEEAFEAAGTHFNLGSPKQIGDIIFGEMGLPGGKKTKTGAWSTDASVLEELANAGHALPRALLTWRQFAKLKSTYSDALKTAINPDTGRVHTSFSLAATTTGRLSSSEPNLQNIPIRTEEGRLIREAFVAEKGHVLVAADYSQIELRLLAHIAGVDALKAAFKAGHDIHAMTASEMFGVPLDQMDPMTRRKAKAINFGIIYGISAFGLANNLGIKRDEAKAYIDSYFEKFPRHCHLYGRDEGGPRARRAISRPCSGGAATSPASRTRIRRCASLQSVRPSTPPFRAQPPTLSAGRWRAWTRRWKKAGLKARMLLQVHDELVFECPQDEADRLIPLVQEVMGEAALPAVSLTVPLVVEAKAALTWGQAH